MVSLLLGAVLMQSYPDPVTGVGAVINPDQTVTMSWTLPADPSVVGVTIFRERMDLWVNDAQFDLVGPVTEFTDTTAYTTISYRYWIHTRDAEGDLSFGVWVEVLAPGGYCCTYDDDDDDWWFFCWGSTSAGAGGGSWLLGVAGSLLALAGFRRRR